MAGPLVRYFLERPGAKVKVADIEVEKARALVGSHPRGEALVLNLKTEEGLKKEIAASDIVVSLVPYEYHPLVAKICIGLRKNMVTASYVDEALKALDADARRAGIVILNEVGLDPGIDHMEAMRIIREVKSRGGKILGLTSYCGGLPAPEAKTNPFGYKFSWSPRGVLLAGKNAARYLMNGKEVHVSAGDLFGHPALVPVKGLGDFEGYPNRNSLPYIELYGITETRTMFRGTLRYPGWCETMKKIGELGLLDQTEKEMKGLTCSAFIGGLIGEMGDKGLKKALSEKLNLEPDSKVIERLEWLGLLSRERLPLERGSALDILQALMLAKLCYEKGERDMIVLRHEFLIADAGGKRQKIISTLIDFGIPGGYSSMARTVGLPAAAGTRLVLEGRIGLTGVLIPVHPEIYEPILEELEGQGLVFTEEKEDVD